VSPGASPSKGPDVQKQYELVLQEYRFQVQLNWDRAKHFLIFNTAILAAGGNYASSSGAVDVPFHDVDPSLVCSLEYHGKRVRLIVSERAIGVFKDGRRAVRPRPKVRPKLHAHACFRPSSASAKQNLPLAR
jgi:hypothetical protein